MKSSHRLLMMAAAAGALAWLAIRGRRLQRDRTDLPADDAPQNASIDDVPTVQAADSDFDSSIAPAAPL